MIQTPFFLRPAVLAGSCVLLFALGAPAHAQQKISKAKGIEFFEKRIRPVLVQHCYKCHSAKKVRGGLVLDTREGIRKGGDTDHAVVPGDVAASMLMKAVEYKNKDLQMPPKGKLPDSVIADLRRWIVMGAPDPRGNSVKTAKKYGPAKDLWSLKPIKSEKASQISDKAWPKSDIDRFVLAKLEEKKLQPVSDASAIAMLRRLHFDLVGLPPSVEVIDRISQDAKPQAAIEKEIDRLLASPQFGERWGRHWLDVARFGESNGRDRDVLFPHAWRYRRYVIDAFNADLPYDRFIHEQVAGDLLSADDQKQKDRLLIATGFLTLGPKSFMKRGKEFEMDLIDEQIDVTTRAFLGLTVSCARCHDHKFDPIPTKDYYSLASIFASTKTLFGPAVGKKNNVNLQAIGAAVKGKPQKKSANPQQVAALNKRIRASTNRLKKIQNGQKVKLKNGKFLTVAIERKRLAKLQNDLKKLGGGKAGGPGQMFCMAVSEGRPVDLRVMIRGDIKKLGAAAPRGFLTSVKLKKEIKLNRSQSGRLEMANWLTDPSNALTARVAVNRIWHHLFGQGLVRTVDNFGANGEKPSHPELLDHLAKKFMDNGWSFKKMIRYIVSSRTYRLAAAYNEKNYQVDPDNRYLWRRSLRRFDVEAIRDSMLAASGKLDLKPPQRSPVAEIGYGEVGRGINTNPLTRSNYHRTVYLPILRTAMPEMLKVWDFAEPSLVVGNRAETNVPNQALFLMNNAFVIENAKAMAERLLEAEMTDAKRADLAYRLAVSRTPSKMEQQRVLAFIDRMQQNLKGKYANETERRRVAWTSFCQALFASAEFRYLN